MHCVRPRCCVGRTLQRQAGPTRVHARAQRTRSESRLSVNPRRFNTSWDGRVSQSPKPKVTTDGENTGEHHTILRASGTSSNQTAKPEDPTTEKHATSTQSIINKTRQQAGKRATNFQRGQRPQRPFRTHLPDSGSRTRAQNASFTKETEIPDARRRTGESSTKAPSSAKS